MKVILACTVRDFEVRDAYEEWDRRLGRRDPGGVEGGKRGVFGEFFCFFTFPFRSRMCRLFCSIYCFLNSLFPYLRDMEASCELVHTKVFFLTMMHGYRV